MSTKICPSNRIRKSIVGCTSEQKHHDQDHERSQAFESINSNRDWEIVPIVRFNVVLKNQINNFIHWSSRNRFIFGHFEQHFGQGLSCRRRYRIELQTLSLNSRRKRSTDQMVPKYRYHSHTMVRMQQQYCTGTAEGDLEIRWTNIQGASPRIDFPPWRRGQ